MPEYLYQCAVGHRTTLFLPVSSHAPYAQCSGCWLLAEQIITAPLLVKVSADVCYDSPIDGSPITSWEKRQEDLKRNNCTPYDPDSKTDYARRIRESEAELDKTIESTVEEAIEKMPTAQRGKLFSELTQQGIMADVVRTTPHAG